MNMKSMMKVLVGLVSVAVLVAVAAPSAQAQCGAGVRAFASQSAGAPINLRIDPAVVPPGSNATLGTEFGRMWQCSDSSAGNNFIPGDPEKKMAPPGTGRCAARDPGQPGGGWWQINQTTLRVVNGTMSTASCVWSTCPQGDLCLVVESFDVAGPPAVGGTAYLIGWRASETPTAARYWDLSRFCGGANCVVPYQEFPVPMITSATKGAGGRRDIVMNAQDPAVNVYVHIPNAGPASHLVESYDLMIHTGTTDPGRNRNATGCAPPNPGGRCWNLLSSISYADAALNNQPINVPCDNIADDSFIAFGATFEGGPPGGPVPSQMVGRAIQIECDPNLADPQPKPKPSIRVPTRSRGGR
jgi:hypothetical protein